MTARPLYRTLNLKPGATADAIRTAYHRLARKHHPDRNPGDARAEARFRAISDAYEVLRDPERRARYDATGDATLPADNTPAEVAATLVPMLLAVVAKLGEMGRKLDQEDVVGHLKEMLKQHEDAVRKRRAETERVAAGLAEAASRLTVRGDATPNILAGAARSQAGKLAEQLRQLDGELGRVAKAREHLSACGYVHVRRAVMRYTGGGVLGFGTSSSATWGVS